MELTILTGLVIGHFVFDFFLQSREMAVKKSSELKWLFKHLVWIWVGAFLPVIIVLGFFVGSSIYTLLTAIGVATSIASIHGIIDWNVWRGYKYLRRHENIETFQYWNDGLFYHTIGLDQMLHILTLVVAVLIFVL